MADQTVKIVDNSQHRVAYDLMQQISLKEFDSKKDAQRDREYWIELFVRCFQATNGYTD